MQTRYLTSGEAGATPAPTVTPAPTQSGEYRRVQLSSSSARLNLRAQPSTTSAILGSLSHGETVRLLSTSGNWARIETRGGQTGYVQTRYLTSGEAGATPAPTQGDVIYCDLRAQATRDAVVYALPGADAVAIIQEGTMVYVKAYNDEWARIASISGLRSGYVLKAHLRLIS